MSWLRIPEFLKKRACRYLLQHYLGQFLEEKISLEDLTVDLYNGTGSIHNIPLNVEAINESLKGVSAPVQVVSGYIECVTVSVPWSALLKDNCKVELSGLTLTVAPHTSFTMEEYFSMTDSLFFSMTSSRQMAEEVLREGQGAGEMEAQSNTGFEGMETLARAIELVLARVQVCLKDTVIQINYDSRPPQNNHNIKQFLRCRIKRIEFYDEVSQAESSVDSPDRETPPPPTDFAVKLLHLLDVSIELGSGSTENDESSVGSNDVESVPIAVAGGKLTITVTIKQSDQVPGPKLNVEGFLGSLHLLLSPQQLGSLLQLAREVAAQNKKPEKLSPGQSRPIPHAERSALESQLAQNQQQERQAKARQRKKQRDLLTSDPWDDPISPQRHPGATISTEPFAPLSDSTADEKFYSLDLNSSYSSSMVDSMSESFRSSSSALTHNQLDNTHDVLLQRPARASGEGQRRGGLGGKGILHRHGLEGDGGIKLHEGLGLQQLSSGPSEVGCDPFDPPRVSFTAQKSPPLKPRPHSLDKQEAAQFSSRRRYEAAGSGSTTKYSLTLNGVTVALLEANPVHTYSTRLSDHSSLSSSDKSTESPPTSMDQGGLDPVRYFELVSEWLSDGINWHSYQQHQKQLAQFLPADHLLVWLSVLRVFVDVDEDQGDYEMTLAGAEVWEHLYHNHVPHINLITRPTSMCPIIQLLGDLQTTPPKPCLRVKVHSTVDNTKKKKMNNPAPSLADVDVALSVVHLNVDPILVDRLQLLLAPPPETVAPSMQRSSMDKVNHSLYMTSSNMHTIQQQRQLLFHQAVHPGYSSSSSTTTLKVKVRGDKLHVSLRFPVPQSKKMQQPPWFRPLLRTEVLFADVSDWLVSTQLHPLAVAGEASYSVEAQFNTAHVFLSMSGSHEDKELFLVVSSKSTAAGSSSMSSVEPVSIRLKNFLFLGQCPLTVDHFQRHTTLILLASIINITCFVYS